MFRRSGDGAFKPVDRRLDQNVVRTSDQKQVFSIVAPHNDELSLPVEVEDIDDVEPAGAIAAAGRAYAASE